MTKREAALVGAQIAGYHNDSAAYLRIRIESHVGVGPLTKAWQRGKILREGGVPCACYECRKAKAKAA